MGASISEHDERQLKRMLDCVASARREECSLQAAADTLLFLRDALEHADSDWERRVTSHIATLESAHWTSAEQTARLGSQLSAIVDEALSALETLIREKL